MHTAVVELDPLPDPVRSAAENDDFLFVGRPGFTFPLVGRVEIWRMGFKFGRTSIDPLVRHAPRLSPLAQCPPPAANGLLFHSQELSQALVGESQFLRLDQKIRPQTCGAECRPFRDESGLEVDQFTNLLQKPGVDLGERE